MVTLVTSSDLPNLSRDQAGLDEALRQRGIDARIAVWDDPAVDWQHAGLCIVLTVTDYAERRQEFWTWLESVPRVLNDARVLRWSSDKHYLIELAERGMPTIETMWMEPRQQLSRHQVHTRMPAGGDFVVKSAVSSNRHTTGRYTAVDARSRAAAIQHARDILAGGDAALVQRYLQSTEEHGEVSLVYFNGMLSHAVAKKVTLQSVARSQVDLGPTSTAIAHRVTAEERNLGEDVRTALHAGVRHLTGRDHLLIYSRVDLIRNGDRLEVLEVNLMDVTLYLTTVDGAFDAFADAIAVRAFC